MYKVAWTPYVGEVLSVKAENNIEHDQHAVAVWKEDSIFGIKF
jgi:hypothetical protein